jgi:hypothetical protein
MSAVEQLLEQIETLSEEEQCELLERLLLRQPSSPEADAKRIRQIRKKLPVRPKRDVARHANSAIAQARRDLARRSDS